MLKTLVATRFRLALAALAVSAAGAFAAATTKDPASFFLLANGPLVFARIRKVDEEKRLVFGRAAEEVVDKSEEIMDYMSSKPHFQKWSADIAADTGGKNLGNVRAMHGKVAAGGLTEIAYDDVGKTIDVCAKIVDDAEWKKVIAGTYTGFSIGGSYVGEKKVEKMADGKSATRYTAKPTEISLVDRPCMTGAKFFEVQKADGTLAKVDFVEPGTADDLEIRGTNEEVIAFGKLMNAEKLTMADVLGKALPAFLAAKKKGAKGADGKDPEDAADDGDDEAAEAKKVAKAAADAAELEKVEAVAADTALTKLEATIAELQPTLAKIGARNSSADKGRLAKIHDAVVELGHDCGDAAAKAAAAAGLAKVAEARELLKASVADPKELEGKTDEEILKLAGALPTALAKAEGERLAKLVDAALAPLQKIVGEQAAKITKLEAQPAAPTVRLRAVSKGEDMVDDVTKVAPAPVIDAAGKPNETAGLIKALHASGGVALHLPRTLRG